MPYAKRWAKEIHGMEMYAIMHSDGQLTPYLDELAGTGIDAHQAIDPIAGMNMAQTREFVGSRLCLCENVNCGLLLRDSPEEVYEATSDLLKEQKNFGAFVLSASNAVQKEVPMENYRAMI